MEQWQNRGKDLPSVWSFAKDKSEERTARRELSKGNLPSRPPTRRMSMSRETRGGRENAVVYTVEIIVRLWIRDGAAEASGVSRVIGLPR